MKLEVLTQSPKGSSKDITLLFIHGSGHAGWCFENYMKYFSDRGYPCCALDLPGHGGSRDFDVADITFDTYVDAVLQVAKGIEGKIVLVGHSMGGPIAQTILAEHPEVACGAVLQASGPASRQPVPEMGGKNAAQAKGEQMRTMFTSEAADQVLRRTRLMTMNKITGGDGPYDPADVRSSTFFSERISLEEASKYGALLQFEPPKPLEDSKNLNVDLSAVAVPVLYVASRGDDLYAEEVAALIAASLHAELVTLEDLCHDMMLDPDWERSADAILQYLSDTF